MLKFLLRRAEGAGLGGPLVRGTQRPPAGVGRGGESGKQVQQFAGTETQFQGSIPCVCKSLNNVGMSSSS